MGNCCRYSYILGDSCHIRAYSKQEINNLDSERGWTPLFYAVYDEDVKYCKTLLLAGADPNIPDLENNDTPLSMAARDGNIEICELLHSHGSVLDKELASRTALHWAAEYGSLPVVEYLVRNGSVVDKPSYYSTGTPLMIAAKKGHTNICQYLLNNNADVNFNFRSNTPLMNACYSYPYGDHKEVVKLLIAAGADISAVDEFGYTALMRAAECGHQEVVKVLIAAGCDVSAANVHGDTAIIQAARGLHDGGSYEVVYLLKAVGGDATAPNKAGYTAEILLKTTKKKLLTSYYLPIISLTNYSQ